MFCYERILIDAVDDMECERNDGTGLALFPIRMRAKTDGERLIKRVFAVDENGINFKV